jgi:ATP-dependent RNA helicase RhlE
MEPNISRPRGRSTTPRRTSSSDTTRPFTKRTPRTSGGFSSGKIITSIGSGTRYEGKKPSYPSRGSDFGVGRPSFGGSSRGDYGAGRGGYGGGSRGGFGGSRGGGRRGPKADFIDENRFINKAAPAAEEVVYTPTHTFSDFKIHETLGKNLAKKNFVHPSPIQDQAIPVALEGKDIIGIAATGTGKTAAFLIPIINKFVDDRMHQAMVLAPTRELAQQIEEEFRLFTVGMRLYSVSAVGGLPITKQIREIDQGVHIVIGTPGRVKDLIERGKLKPADFNTIVLDEADRMLDMGFVDDMRQILGAMPEAKQSMFFSATFSPEIKKLCGDFLRDPVTISLKTRDTSASVDQDIVRVPRGTEKIEVLHDLLNKEEFKKVLIFRETKRNTDELARDLKKRGFAAMPLHGDMRSRERMRTVESFSKGMTKIVVATDVAARGIDIPDITHVINYDVPSTYDTYVHRIGRTGRGTKKGTALTFVR